MMKWQPRKKVGGEAGQGPRPAPPGRAAPAAAGGAVGLGPVPVPGRAALPRSAPPAPRRVRSRPQPWREASRTFPLPPAAVAPRPPGTPRGSGRGARAGPRGRRPLRSAPAGLAGRGRWRAVSLPVGPSPNMAAWLEQRPRSPVRGRAGGGRAGPPFVGARLASAVSGGVPGAGGRWPGARARCGGSRGSAPGRTFCQRAWRCFLLTFF